MLYILRKCESGKQRVWSPCEMTGSKQSCVMYPQIRNEAAAEENAIRLYSGMELWDLSRYGQVAPNFAFLQGMVSRWDDLCLLFLIS